MKPSCAREIRIKIYCCTSEVCNISVLPKKQSNYYIAEDGLQYQYSVRLRHERISQKSNNLQDFRKPGCRTVHDCAKTHSAAKTLTHFQNKEATTSKVGPGRVTEATLQLFCT